MTAVIKLVLIIIAFLLIQICYYTYNNQIIFNDSIFFANYSSPIIYIKKFNITYIKNSEANFSAILVPMEAPIILEWNTFNRHSTFDSENIHQKDCPQKCIYTDDKKLHAVADMITFNFGIRKDVAPIRNPNRLNVFITFESPEHRPNYIYAPKDYFNVTATYRQDSDIVLLYDFFVPITNRSQIWDQKEVDRIIAKKSKPALFLVSHCKTPSKRENLVADIQKYMNVSQFGYCNGKQCKGTCETENIESHYFTLGFENSDCIDYVTEKVYRLRKLIVPIILDRNILRGVHAKLNPYVIAVSDFNSTKALTDYLKFLMANQTEYRKYFEWTKLYEKNPPKELLEDLTCSLCEIAWKRKEGYGKIIPDIQKWWGNQKCRTHFGVNFVNNLTQSLLIYDNLNT